MLKKLTDDLYPYLKSRGWGKALIAFISLSLILFAIWSSLTPSQKERLFPVAAPEKVAAQSGNIATGGARTYTEDELNMRNLVINTCRDVNELRKEFELARQLESPTRRESEFASLAVDATCANEEGFALELFAKLISVDTKDGAAKQVITEYLRKRQFAQAQKWVTFLSNKQDRDWWTGRILDESGKNR